MDNPHGKKKFYPARKAAPKPPARGQDLLSRRVAMEMAIAVLDQSRMMDEAFEDSCAATGIVDGRDRAFARLIGTTIVRRTGQIDDAIGRYLTRDLAPKAQRVRQILRVGAAQILFCGTPAHSAVDTSVALVSRERNPGNRAFKGLVNAVLRRISENRDAILTAQDDVALNTPAWLFKTWEARFGAARARDIAKASLQEAPLDIQLKPGLDPAEWATKLGAEILPTGSLRLTDAGRIETLAGFAEGQWWVQDMAASLPARLVPAKAGDRVLDLCAAPGGKTAQLAARGAIVTAIDQSAVRLERLKENLTRLNLEAEIVVSDAAAYKPREAFPYILLDAPCTTTGTLRRHPDVMHHKASNDVASMAAVQARLLAAAVTMLQPGGILVYCVCSLQAEEGPERIEALLASGAPIERMPISPDEIGGISDAILPSGDVQTTASLSPGMDGFFISRLKHVKPR